MAIRFKIKWRRLTPALWWYSFKKVDNNLKLLFGFAILSTLNYNCRFFTRTSEDKFLVGFNDVLVQVCYSIIASFIFYLIFQVYQESKKRIGIIDFVATKAGWMAAMSTYFISDVLYSYTGVPRNQPQKHTRDEAFKIFHTFSLTKVVSKTYPNTSYLEAVSITCDFLEKGLDTFLSYADLFKPEWVECIANIDKNITEFRLMYNSGGTNLGAYGEKFWIIHFELVRLAEIASNERDKVFPLLKQSRNSSLHKEAIFGF